jgi:hypothetical protein
MADGNLAAIQAVLLRTVEGYTPDANAPAISVGSPPPSRLSH